MMIHTDVKSFLQDIASFLLSLSLTFLLISCSRSGVEKIRSRWCWRQGKKLRWWWWLFLYALLVCCVCFNLWQVFTVDERKLLKRGTFLWEEVSYARKAPKHGIKYTSFFSSLLFDHHSLYSLSSSPPTGNLWLSSLSIKLCFRPW